VAIDISPFQGDHLFDYIKRIEKAIPGRGVPYGTTPLAARLKKIK
jgi:hypothetical protein